MNCRLSFILASILALSYQSFVLAETENSDYESMKLGLNQFSNNLYKAALKYTSGTFLFAPLSAATTLGLLANAAAGNTQQELIQGLNLQMTQDNLKQMYHDLLWTLKNTTDVEYNSANSLFIEKQYDIKQSFQDLSYNTFQSEVQKVDLKDTTNAAKIINDYSKEKTGGKIDNIVTSDDLSNAAMVVTNSINFKGTWKYPFSSETVEVPFYLSPNNSVPVPMMCLQTDVNHGPILDKKALFVELQYWGDFSLILVIPNAIDGLHLINQKISEINWGNLIGDTHAVNICIPEMTFEYNFDPVPAFKSLGINEMFTSNAKFTNIGDVENLQASKIAQKIILNIDKSGTQLASGGANVHDAGHHHEAVHGAHHVHQIRLDRGSIAAIVSKSAGVPIIIGQITDSRPKTHQ